MHTQDTPPPNLLELLGYADLEDRVRDLEADNRTLREMVSVGIDANRRLLMERDRLTRERDYLRDLVTHWTGGRRTRPRRAA